ncbi:MAG: type II toxin-antitoxin system RelE/ParE family toxin [Alphaproteobacteria bacterium]|nr:type II toxin-antitoxin system RelE/ParE family toxin [Alphaproteobacteria bacterium]
MSQRDIRLALRARQDLKNIARYGDRNFAARQSDTYRQRLEKQFAAIAENPYRFPAVDHIRPGFRRAVMQSHAIYFKVAEDHVLIIRVLRQEDTGGALPQ